MPTSPPDSPPGSSPFPFSPQDAMEFMQRMWNPFGMPIPGFGVPGVPTAGQGSGLPFPNPAAMWGTLDPAEVERKIGDLKVIEGWLQMSLNLMQMSIKTMELQKASLEALRGSHSPPEPEAPAKSAPHRRKT
jgi:hypothetical protein